MNVLIPGNVPQLHPMKVREILQSALEKDAACNWRRMLALCPVVVLAVRGYYRDTMGAAGRNDVGIFDDAAFILSGKDIYRFNWNTDPVKVGWNPGVEKNFAMLTPGIWPFVKGQHKQKGAAWRQSDELEANTSSLDDIFSDDRAEGFFKVWRASSLAQIAAGTAPTEWGYQAINQHWGSEYGTSSWGCQTAPPSQWPAYQKTSYALTKPQPWLPYVLVDALPD